MAGLPVSAQIIRPVANQKRTGRSPSHDFWIKHRPYQITPFHISPVMPAETMTGAFLQSRTKSDALTSEFLGWWLEHFVFYVKLRDLDGADDFTAMIMTAGYDLSAYNAAANVKTYHAGPGIDWLDLCMDKIVEDYFRDEGDATTTFDGYHQAHIMGETWLDSAKLDSDTETSDHELPGENPTVDDELSGAFSSHFTQFEHMKALGFTTATFEDWLKSFGVKPETKDDERRTKPELIRYLREFSYPSVVVDGDGTSNARCVFNTAESFNKRRFFPEPGFLIGCTVARPKVYLSHQTGTGSGMFNDAYAWFPAVLRDSPFTSLKQFAVSVADGPLGANPSEAYWVDLRDLLIHGDQFVNFDISADPAGTVALPTAAMQKKFATETQIDKLWVDAVGGNEYFEQEGNFKPTILSQQAKDHT